MSQLMEKNYTVRKTLDFDEYLRNESSYLHGHPYDKTDIFNKSSKTTVCFYGAHGARVMYCENCDETHTNQMAMEVEIRDYVFQNANTNTEYEKTNIYPTKITCKKCGSSYNMKDIRTIQHYRHAQDSDIRAVYNTVFNENGLVKLSMKVCTMVAERGFYSVDNMYKIIFNTKTGQTYLYNNPLNKKNKIRPIYAKNTLENIYLRGAQFDYMFNKCLFDVENPDEYKVDKIKEIYTLIYKNICDNLGYNPKTLEDYAKEFDVTKDTEIYSFKTLALYNRFPNLNTFGILDFETYYSSKVAIFKKMKKIKNTSKQPLLELAKLYNVKRVDLFEEFFYSQKAKVGDVMFLSSLFGDGKYLDKSITELSGKIYPHMDPSTVDMFGQRRRSKDNACVFFFKDIKKCISEEDFYSIIESYYTNNVFNCAMKEITTLYFILKSINNNFRIDMEYFNEMLFKLLDETQASSAKSSFLSFHADISKFKHLKLIEDYLTGEFNKKTHKKSQKQFKFKLSTIEDYRKSFNKACMKKSGLISKLYYDAPHFNPYILADMFVGKADLNRQIRVIEHLNAQKYFDKSNLDVLRGLFDRFNIPNVKSLRNKVLNCPEIFPALIFYSQSFKDVNGINKILDAIKSGYEIEFEFGYSFLEVFNKFFEVDNPNEFSTIHSLHKITQCLVDTFGETIAAKKIAGAYKNGQKQEMKDIWPMYELYLQLYPGQPIDLTGNIKEIHDRLVALTGGSNRPFTKQDFKPFKYTQEERELSAEMAGYKFNLAKNGQELAILGKELKNCVRSYVKLARKKQCYIVSVTHEDKYKICIELVPAKPEDGDYKYLLRQAKLFANTPVYEDKESLNIVLQWMLINRIKADSSDVDTNRGLCNFTADDIIDENDINYELAVPF